MMRGIRGKDTKPELLIRKVLFARGFRYRLHDKRLPGKPDLVFPAYSAVIFIHGCFWHGHKCHLFKWPQTRKEFWRNKINRNRAVDRQAIKKLNEQGWYVLTVWECALKGKKRKPLDKIADRIARWLESGTNDLEISG
jgi:DNA mismatch endonuclease (patch repair protein)